MTVGYRGDRGWWRYEFIHHGKKHTKGRFDTKRAAALAEHDLKKALAITTREAAPVERLTLGEYVGLWTSAHVKTECRVRTGRSYAQALARHVLPKLGNVPLEDLTRVQLKTHFNELAASGLARNTVKNALIPLRSCLANAVEDGLIPVNPAAGIMRRVRRPRTEQEAQKVASYTPKQLEAILAADAGDYNDFLRLLAHSGVRLGEALGLQPDDIGEDHLWVRRSVQWLDRECHVFAPKGGGQRRVDIPARLAYDLRGRTGPWLFGGETPWRPERVRKAWKQLLAGLDVPKLRLHDLRHTYAAMLLTRGAPPGYVKEQLGHSSIEVTVDIYGHLIPGSNRQWVDATFS